jgi:hypothetical protein
VSSIVPLTLFEIFMSLRSTLSYSSGFMIFRTASTAIGERVILFPLTTLLDNEVFTQFINDSLSDNKTGIVMLFNTSMHFISAV